MRRGELVRSGVRWCAPMLRSYSGPARAPSPSPEFPSPRPYYKANLAKSYGEKLLFPPWEPNPPFIGPPPYTRQNYFPLASVQSAYHRPSPPATTRLEVLGGSIV